MRPLAPRTISLTLKLSTFVVVGWFERERGSYTVGEEEMRIEREERGEKSEVTFQQSIVFFGGKKERDSKFERSKYTKTEVRQMNGEETTASVVYLLCICACRYLLALAYVFSFFFLPNGGVLYLDFCMYIFYYII